MAREHLDKAEKKGWPALQLAQRFLLFTLYWWLLTEGQDDAWLFGIPVVLLAAVASYAMAPPRPRSLQGLLHFLPFFIIHSLRGASDVTRRAFHPALPIRPVIVDYHMRLAGEEARVFMANTVSLVPGTLAARFDGSHLQVHVLDGRSSYLEELETLERHVAAIFRLPQTLTGDGDG